MLDNQTKEKPNQDIAVFNVEDTVASIKDYTGKALLLAQLISEDFFGKYSMERNKEGQFNRETMIYITYEMPTNETLLEIVYDYLLKISAESETVLKAFCIERENNKVLSAHIARMNKIP